MTAKTILGTELKRLCRSTVNGLAGGRKIPVRFRGTGAWTDNRIVSLPQINDLATIDWGEARGLIGYAIHEVSHNRETDFAEVKRAAELGKLVKSFENAMEDYRIERLTTRKLKGTHADLEVLRNKVHPKPDRFRPSWYADPRQSGPLALTWTGSQLNGFRINGMAETLAMFDPAMRAMLTRWTALMKDVQSTAEVVDLAIQFAAEAEAYAKALDQAAQDLGDDDTSDQCGDTSDTNSPGSPGSNVDQGESEDEAEGDTGQTGGDDDTSSDENDSPWGDALSPDAQIEDVLDQIADAIRDAARKHGAPEKDPEPTDGELDPSAIVDKIDEANAEAPEYDSDAHAPDPDGSEEAAQADNPPGTGAAQNQWSDHRFHDVEPCGDGSAITAMRDKAAGTISTTARTIRRLLVAEDKRGTLRNRRSGEFDIRNISGIVRNTGSVYRKTWVRPGTSTLLATLVDLSGSMSGNPVMLAMTGALALTEATRGTQIENWIYGYTGCSPHVALHEFAGPKTAAQLVQRRIDSIHSIGMGATPTGEAIAAIGARMDYAPHDRRVLVVLTDGDADDMNLCKGAARLLETRGIEVAAIGIGRASVSQWATNYHVIHDIAQLPEALLNTIDPRISRRRAA